MTTESLDWNALWDEDENRFRVQTRDGTRSTSQGNLRIWVTDARAEEPVHGEILGAFDKWVAVCWRSDGLCILGQEWGADLFPEPRTIRRWVNVYRYDNGKHKFGSVFPYTEREQAEQRIVNNDTYIATVPVEWEE